MLRSSLFSFMFLVLLNSCNNDSSADSISAPVSQEDQDEVVEAIIDDSDLNLLPKDTGGRQA
ncbi:MAG: hypothetical protein WBV45_04875 [Lutimonas sp.]